MKVPTLTGLAEIAHRYRLIVCDLWGVVHNGKHAFPDALTCLAGLREAGAIIHLVSNAPRPKATIAVQLRQFGVSDEYYDELVTSGDTTQAALNGDRPFGPDTLAGPGLTQYSGARCLHIGPDRDLPLFEGLECELLTGLNDAQFEEADFLLCTGLVDDEIETVNDYRSWLIKAVSRDLLMVCANPDLLVMRGNDRIPCAGAVASLYEALGGRVRYFGKPHAEVYLSCLDLWRAKSHASNSKGRLDPAQVLVIGDSLHTDIPGARRMGFQSLLITGGIHAHEFGVLPNELPKPNVLEQVCEMYKVRPDFALASLIWLVD